MGLEEGDSEAADKPGCKNRVRGHPEKAVEEREAGGFQGREHAQPFIFLPVKQGKPAVKQLRGNGETFTEFFYGSRAQEIHSQDMEEEEQAVRGIRDDEVRQYGMGMSAGTNEAEDADTVPGWFSAQEINQGTVIVGMDGAGAPGTTAGAGLQFRTETRHEGIKKIIR